MGNRYWFLSAGRLLSLSFLFVIFCGFILLSLPVAQLVPISWFDLLFTVTSVTCVTGLSVVPIHAFSWFGHIVILCLMQVGGLGLMTFSLFLVSLFSQFGLATTVMAGKLLDFELMNRIKFFLGMVVIITCIVELFGMIALFPFFAETMPVNQALFYALFHSVSAFCNAGICLFDSGLEAYQNNIVLLSIIGMLAFFGGIGFVVWYEVAERIRYWIFRLWNKELKIHIFSLHTKLVVWTSVILIIFGAVVYAVNEWNYAWGHLTAVQKVMNAFFLSIVSRSAGFTVISISSLRNSTLLTMMGLMFIGASPGSTGSGIKTTTIALIFATMISVVKGRTHVECFGREIPDEQIYKAITIIMLGLCWLGFTACLLLWVEKGYSFIDIFFEAVSAFTTVGFSRGITSELTMVGKGILIASMLVGRIGSLTLVFAIKRLKEKKMYRFPEERVLIG